MTEADSQAWKLLQQSGGALHVIGTHQENIHGNAFVGDDFPEFSHSGIVEGIPCGRRYAAQGPNP